MTLGSVAISSSSALRSGIGSRRASSAVTPTLLSMNSIPEFSPLMTMKRAASRTSMRMTVAVAARLIIALRQKPCQARTMVKPMKRAKAIGLVLALVGGFRLVTHKGAVFECEYPASHGVHDLLVVGGHQDGGTEAVDLDQELDDLP